MMYSIVEKIQGHFLKWIRVIFHADIQMEIDCCFFFSPERQEILFIFFNV